MSGDYHFGDEVTQYGDGNIGMIKNEGPADPRAALRELVSAVQILRGQVTSSADLQLIDESMSTIRMGQGAEKGSMRRALGTLAGIATVLGQVGAPVVDAVRQAMTAFGI